MRWYERAVEKVKRSLEEFGWRQPIVVDAEWMVVAGHTRLLAARELGLAKVPVHVAKDLTPDQIRAYRLADNRMSLVTRDHSEVRELMDAGVIDAAEAARHPLRNVITRSLGSDPAPTADTWVLAPREA